MKRLLGTVITLVVLGWFISIAVVTQDIGRIILLIRSTKFAFYLVFLLITALAVSLSSTNLFLLLLPFKNSPSWKRVFKLDLLSLLGVYYTPGGSGALAFLVYMLKKEGVEPEDSTSCFLLDKFITLAMAVCSFIILLFFYTRTWIVALDVTKAALSAGGILALSLIALAFRATRRFAVLLVDRIAIFRRYPMIVLTNLVITAGVFFLSACQFYFVFRALDLKPPEFSRLLISYGPISIMGYLPFTISGAGVSETVAVAMWRGPGLGSEEIIAAFLVARIFTLVTTFILPALIYGSRFWQLRFSKDLRKLPQIP